MRRVDVHADAAVCELRSEQERQVGQLVQDCLVLRPDVHAQHVVLLVHLDGPLGREGVAAGHQLLVAVVQHPQLGLELGFVQDVAQPREIGGDLGRLGQGEVVGQLYVIIRNWLVFGFYTVLVISACL